MESTFDLSQENVRLGSLGSKMWTRGLAVGVLGMLAALVVGFLRNDGFERFAWSYLVNFLFFVSLGLGALFWVLIQHVTRSGWSVVLRRLMEGVMATLPLLGVLGLPLVLFVPKIFLWADPQVAIEDPLVAHKVAYLNVPFFSVRLLIYLVVWGVAGYMLFRASVAQDADGDHQRTLRLERHSTWLLMVYALTVTFAAFDLIMSLDPHWFSTIFGVYFFAGASLGFLSLLAVLTFVVQRGGALTNAITTEHYHDIGKLMFGFVVFWAYIAFSQYMLIWYAHIPEETGWFLRRQSGPWLPVSIFLILGHFALPFLALISRVPKRMKGVLAGAGLYLLAAHWIDLYWLVMPEFGIHKGGHGKVKTLAELPFSSMDLLLLLGFGGLFVAVIARSLSRVSLLPEKDPRLAESLTFENA